MSKTDAVTATDGGSPLMLSPRMMRRTTRGILENIDLMVCDMAGTTVEEGGQVYVLLQAAMNEAGLKVSNDEMHPWHGAKKEAVIAHFAMTNKTPAAQIESLILTVSDRFVEMVQEAYFRPDSGVAPINVGLPGYVRQLQATGMKFALCTGYPVEIQQALVKALDFEDLVDGYVSAYEVPEGRPYPYMVHRLMERLHICSAERVCKVGDSVRDIEEGRNAGCGLVVGVLSGADSGEALMAAGADIVAECVTDLPVPRRAMQIGSFRLPDLS